MANENLLEPGVFYYHPLTRKDRPVPKLVRWPDGEVTELEYSIKIEFRSSLSPEEIVDYYHHSVAASDVSSKLKKDAGGVRYLLKHMSLDLALFAIDSLATHYLEAENRPRHPYDLVEASNFTDEANHRLGSVKQVAQQYGIDEASYAREAS